MKNLTMQSSQNDIAGLTVDIPRLRAWNRFEIKFEKLFHLEPALSAKQAYYVNWHYRDDAFKIKRRELLKRQFMAEDFKIKYCDFFIHSFKP